MNINMKQGFGKGQVKRPDIGSRDYGIQKIQCNRNEDGVYGDRRYRSRIYIEIEIEYVWTNRIIGRLI